jgi:hypothetical protein
MSLSEDLETLSPADEVQKAYDASGSTKLGDELLHPWTIARHSAAMSMGCGVISAIGPDTVGLLSKGSYRNVLRDVIIAVWLCSIDADRVEKINARMDVEKAIAEAFKFAEQRKITYGSKLFLDGVKLLSSVVSQVLDSFYSIEGNVRDEVKKKDGTPLDGKYDSPTTPLGPVESPRDM